MTVIDMHNHIVPHDFPADPTGGKLERWPVMERTAPDKATVMIAGKPYRKIDIRCWDAESKVTGMIEDGVDMHLVSPMPELLSYWFEPAHAAVLGRHIARATADLAKTAPDRFAGLGMVPLQDPTAAAAELRVLKAEFGMKGVEVGSHVMGRSLGDPALDPFYAAAEALDMALFVHAVRPIGADRWGGHPMMAGLVGYPIETALAVASVISGRVMERFPKLKIVFAHGGGGALGVIPRLVQAWNQAPGARDAFAEHPMETARRFYYDTVVFEPAVLRMLVDVFGADRLMLGTDFPFGMRERRPADFVRDAGLAKGETEAILGGNARRVFGL